MGGGYVVWIARGPFVAVWFMLDNNYHNNSSPLTNAPSSHVPITGRPLIHLYSPRLECAIYVHTDASPAMIVGDLSLANVHCVQLDSLSTSSRSSWVMIQPSFNIAFNPPSLWWTSGEWVSEWVSESRNHLESLCDWRGLKEAALKLIWILELFSELSINLHSLVWLVWRDSRSRSSSIFNHLVSRYMPTSRSDD